MPNEQAALAEIERERNRDILRRGAEAMRQRMIQALDTFLESSSKLAQAGNMHAEGSRFTVSCIKDVLTSFPIELAVYDAEGKPNV